MTYYEILGVAPNATPAMIRAAYQKLLEGQAEKGSNQPDDPAARMLIGRIVEAYMVLSDEKKRATYDREIKYLAAIQGIPLDDEDGGRTFFSLGRARRSPRQRRMALIIMGFVLIAIWSAIWMTTSKYSSMTARPPARPPVVTLSSQTVATKPPVPTVVTVPVQEESAADYMVPAVVTGLQIALKHPDRPEENSGRTLSVPTISVKLGGRDPEATATLLKERANILRLQLQERLSRAKIGEMMTADGEEYLAQMIVDAIFQAVPEAQAETGGRITVLLPDRFEVN